MDEYLRLMGSSWVVDGSGQWRSFRAGEQSTLRSDFITSLGSQIRLVAAEPETQLSPIVAQNLDLNERSYWTAAVAAGFRVQNDPQDVEIVAYWDGSGTGSSRTVRLKGNPDMDIALAAGEMQWSQRLEAPRFARSVLVHFVDSHVGVYIIALRKGPS